MDKHIVDLLDNLNIELKYTDIHKNGIYLNLTGF